MPPKQARTRTKKNQSERRRQKRKKQEARDGLQTPGNTAILSWRDLGKDVLKRVRRLLPRTINPAAPTLLSLPPEVFEQIAEHVGPQDLTVLRLVSRDVGAKTQRTFTRVCFVEKGFMIFSQDSLDIALQIAEHPSYGPAVRTLRFYVDTIDYPVPATWIPGGLRGGYLDWDRGQRQETAWCNQYSSQRAGTSIFNLARVLGVLHTYGKLNKIILTSLRNETGRPLMPPGYPWWNQTSHDYDETFAFIVNEAFLTVEMALKTIPGGGLTSLRSFRAHGIQLEMVPSALNITITDQWGLPMSVKQILRSSCLLQQVTEVQLDIASCLQEEVDHGITTLFEVLARNHKFTSLDLTFRRFVHDIVWSHDSTAGDILMKHRFRGLQYLKLRWAWLKLEDLEKFIRAHPGLQSLTFEEAVWLTVTIDDYALVCQAGSKAMLEAKTGFRGFKNASKPTIQYMTLR